MGFGSNGTKVLYGVEIDRVDVSFGCGAKTTATSVTSNATSVILPFP